MGDYPASSFHNSPGDDQRRYITAAAPLIQATPQAVALQAEQKSRRGSVMDLANEFGSLDMFGAISRKAPS